jgi:hypothetical protein
VSCAGLCRGHSEKADHAPDDSDGEHHQSYELLGTKGRQLLDLPSPDGSSRGDAEPRCGLQQAPGAPPPDQVLDKYIQAVGGAERLARLTSFVGKGTASLFGGGFKSPVEIYVKAPNQRTTIIHQELGDKTMTFDGRAGWLASAVTPVPVMELTGGELEGAKLEAELSIPGRVKQALGQWRSNLPSSIGGRDVNVLQGTGAGGNHATLYFDVESGLLTRIVRYANSAMGRVPTQIDFEDYREVAGVKLPFKWAFAWVSGRDVVELSEVQPNAAIDAAKFAKPSPAVPR